MGCTLYIALENVYSADSINLFMYGIISCFTSCLNSLCSVELLSDIGHEVIIKKEQDTHLLKSVLAFGLQFAVKADTINVTSPTDKMLLGWH